MQGYNATLFGSLRAAGLRVIPLDTFDFTADHRQPVGVRPAGQRHFARLRRTATVPGLRTDRSFTALTWAFADGAPDHGRADMLASTRSR